MIDISIGSVKIPLNDFAISGTAWLGIKKAGKTYGAKGVAEQLIDHGVPLIVFDAIGVWRFLKNPGNGTHAKGFKVVVAGGEDPDIPLTAHNAAEIIRAAMRSNVSLVIDLYDSKLSKADWRKIVQTGFNTLLYENKKYGTRNIILEEAAEYVPQKVYDGETYAAVEKLVRMGGNAGLGIQLINQRSQEVNKAVLDLCDNLVLMRQRGNSAIDAVQKWMDKVSPDIADKITASLPNMSKGQCWVWAENSDTPVDTQTAKIRSYHPDRTERAEDIKTRKAVDTAEFVSTLLSELPKVVEEQKQKDPVALKKRIAMLESELQDAKKLHFPKVVTEHKEVSVLKDGQIARVEKLADRFAAVGEKLFGEMQKISFAVGTVREQARKAGSHAPPAVRPREQSRPVVAVPTPHSNGDSPTGGLRRMMIALANRPHISAEQVGVRAGLSSKSGSFGTYLGKGRSNGWIMGDRNSLTITPAGVEALGQYEELPTGSALLQFWTGELGGGASRMLQELASVHPLTLSADEIGERANISSASGSFGTYLGRLRSLELVTGNRSALKASDELFD